MIKSFARDATIFTSNGQRVIQPILCREHRELGDWFVELVAPLEFQAFLEHDMILVVPTKEKGEQPFRIKNPKVSRKVEVKAYHIGFDLLNYAVELSTVVDENCTVAMETLLAESEDLTNFTVYSNITTSKSFSVIDSSLYDGFKQIADEYNGVLDFDGWQVRITSSIGSDNGVVLAYGINIQESEITENWDLVVTKLKPIGNEGITLTEIWLEAAELYDRPYTKIMQFDSDVEPNLRMVAQLYLDRYKVPRVNYKVQANVEQNVALGDAIVVRARQFTTTTEVLSYDYNPISERVVNVEFGNFRNTLKTFFTELVAEAEEKAVKRAQLKIDDVNGAVTILAGDYNDGLLTGAKYVFDGTNASFYGAGFKLYDDDDNLKVYFDVELGNYVFTGSIDTSENVTVGKKIILEEIPVTTITELVQERAGKNGISWGESDPPTTYPKAFVTAFNRGPLAEVDDLWTLKMHGEDGIEVSQNGLSRNLLQSIIVDSGSESGAYWEIYGDGTMKCWFTDTNTTTTSTLTSGVYHNNKSFTFPKKFKSTPTVIPSTRRDTNLQWAGLRDASTTACDIYIFSPVSNTSKGYLGYVAFGVFDDEA